MRHQVKRQQPPTASANATVAAGRILRTGRDDVAVIVVIGERLVAPLTLAPEGYRLAARPIPGATSPWAWSLPTDARAVAREADAETDNRPLHVLFEIGSFEMPASKVKQLARSALLPLQPLQDQAVDIMIAGRWIGRGTLMQRQSHRCPGQYSMEHLRPAPGVIRA